LKSNSAVERAHPVAEDEQEKDRLDQAGQDPGPGAEEPDRLPLPHHVDRAQFLGHALPLIDQRPAGQLQDTGSRPPSGGRRRPRCPRCPAVNSSYEPPAGTPRRSGQDRGGRLDGRVGTRGVERNRYLDLLRPLVIGCGIMRKESAGTGGYSAGPCGCGGRRRCTWGSMLWRSWWQRRRVWPRPPLRWRGRLVALQLWFLPMYLVLIALTQVIQPRTAAGAWRCPPPWPRRPW
jgi:hypothetical protein